MTFTDAVRTCLREKYATFQGRAARSEYWWFFLFLIITMFVLMAILGGIAGVAGVLDNPDGVGALGYVLGALGLIVYIGLIIPMIAVTVRRFHDYNLSGWWYLGLIVLGAVPFVNIVASIANLVIPMLKGTQGPNKFGPDPLGVGDAEIFS